MSNDLVLATESFYPVEKTNLIFYEDSQSTPGIKKFKFTGVHQLVDVVNKNLRIYSEEAWQFVFNDPEFQQKQESHTLLGTIDHPKPGATIPSWMYSHYTKDIKRIGNEIHATDYSTSGPFGRLLVNYLVDDNIKYGVSSRGRSAHESINHPQYGRVERMIAPFYLEGWDYVLNPSTYGCYTTAERLESRKVMENYEPLLSTFKRFVHEELDSAASPEYYRGYAQHAKYLTKLPADSKVVKYVLEEIKPIVKDLSKKVAKPLVKDINYYKSCCKYLESKLSKVLEEAREYKELATKLSNTIEYNSKSAETIKSLSSSVVQEKFTEDAKNSLDIDKVVEDVYTEMKMLANLDDASPGYHVRSRIRPLVSKFYNASVANTLPIEYEEFVKSTAKTALAKEKEYNSSPFAKYLRELNEAVARSKSLKKKKKDKKCIDIDTVKEDYEDPLDFSEPKVAKHPERKRFVERTRRTPGSTPANFSQMPPDNLQDYTLYDGQTLSDRFSSISVNTKCLATKDFKHPATSAHVHRGEQVKYLGNIRGYWSGKPTTLAVIELSYKDSIEGTIVSKLTIPMDEFYSYFTPIEENDIPDDLVYPGDDYGSYVSSDFDGYPSIDSSDIDNVSESSSDITSYLSKIGRALQDDSEFFSESTEPFYEEFTSHKNSKLSSTRSKRSTSAASTNANTTSYDPVLEFVKNTQAYELSHSDDFNTKLVSSTNSKLKNSAIPEDPHKITFSFMNESVDEGIFNTDVSDLMSPFDGMAFSESPNTQ